MDSSKKQSDASAEQSEEFSEDEEEDEEDLDFEIQIAKNRDLKRVVVDNACEPVNKRVRGGGPVEKKKPQGLMD